MPQSGAAAAQGGITLRDVRHVYPGAAGPRVVLDGISLAIARGEQTIKAGWAKRLRALKSLGKKKAKTPTK